MTYQLTNEEKLTIINQHLRTLEFSKYNYQMSLLEEQAVQVPAQETIDSINEQLLVLNQKIDALAEEAAGLE